jgi:hypothetical protein
MVAEKILSGRVMEGWWWHERYHYAVGEMAMVAEKIP